MARAALDDFVAAYGPLARSIVDEMASQYEAPAEAVAWIRRALDYVVPGGKLNRGVSVIDSYRALVGERALSAEEVERCHVLGWCVEWLQAFFLVADDIMDQSVTRRGQPCWYKVDGVGHIAINDAFLLESCIYKFLKRTFRQQPYYVDLIELLHETTYQTELGQLVDLITAPEGTVDLARFSMAKYKWIVKYKTAYYSFYLPVAMAMVLAGLEKDTAPFKQAEAILLEMGEYFQVQDDYLDCFGDPQVIGKVGTDIQDNKCSWLVNSALELATPEQRAVLEANYGQKHSSEAVARVKALYVELGLPAHFAAYEEASYARLSAQIAAVTDPRLPPSVFTKFVQKIYKRTK